jgi:DNA mismatch repair ATPase MutS
MQNDTLLPQLKEYEEKITTAEEKMLQIELHLFDALLNELARFSFKHSNQCPNHSFY